MVKVMVKDGTVYEVREAVSVGVALEYVKRFMGGDGEGGVSHIDEGDEGDGELTKKKKGKKGDVDGDARGGERLMERFLRRTCANMDDVGFLVEKTVVGSTKGTKSTKGEEESTTEAQGHREEGDLTTKGTNGTKKGEEEVFVPLHHAFELLRPMRRAIHFQDLIELVIAQRQAPDPDFPEESEKN